MNTNPKSKVVLCYGDSNTNGAKPDRSGRFDVSERWTGLLQDKLGDDYYVIEEGLGGRTTDLEHYNPDKPTRNGIVYFKACIDSHMPLDYVIIMLGTNDLKSVYNRSVEDIANALRQFPEYVEKYCEIGQRTPPKIILASPAYMDETAEKFYESMPKQGIYDEISAQKSKQFAEPIRKVAEESGCIFFDAATVTKTGADGCHLDAQSHQNLAVELEKLLRDN